MTALTAFAIIILQTSLTGQKCYFLLQVTKLRVRRDYKGKIIFYVVANIQILCEKCPYSEFFLVRIFAYSDCIRSCAPYLSVFSLNAGKFGPEKLRIRTLFTQWDSFKYQNSVLIGAIFVFVNFSLMCPKMHYQLWSSFR